MANPKLAALSDAFSNSVIDTTVWNASTAGSTLDIVNDVVSVSVPTSAGASNGLGAAGPYDATSSSLYAQVTAAPNGNGGAQTLMRIVADASNSVQAVASSGGAFVVQVQTGGVSVTTTLPPYDAHAHRWWRIAEVSGTFVFAAGPDGLNWTTLATVTYAWSATAVSVYLQTGATDTEPSGMVATFAHINTPLGGPTNPNWPTVEHGWGAAWSANGGDSPLDRYVDLTRRTRNSVSVSRGRQYELDQVRSGESSVELTNTDGVLDPVNASGPYYGHILPYQPYRIRAQWPPTRNLLTQIQATAGDMGGAALGAITSGPGIFSVIDTSGGSFVASSSAWQGATTMQFSVPSGTPGNSSVVYTPQPAVEPGAIYTNTIRARNITPGTTVQVYAGLVWFDTQTQIAAIAGATATLTGSATAGWTTLTVTGKAPANVALLRANLRTAAAPSATCSVQVDGWQLERAATASAWACPGVWHPVYAGYTERWPSSWDMQGTYGKVAPTCVDALSLLSQKQLSDPLTQEINGNRPRFAYRLDDPSGSMGVTEWTGAYPAAPLGISKYGAGSLTLGTTITATNTTGVYTGSSGTVATLTNASPGTNATAAATFIKLAPAGITGPADPTLWTRMIAFRYTGPLPTVAACMWSAMDSQRSGGTPSGSHLYVYLDTTGRPVFNMQGPGGASSLQYFGGATNCVDGDWHLLVFGYNQTTGQLILSQDGTSTTISGVASTVTPTGIVGDNLGGFVDITIGNGTTWNWKGDLSFAAEFPTLLTSTAITNLYAAWRSACAGESTSARYARILRYAGYTGPSTIQAGLTTSMGPAAIVGQDVVTALQAVVDTENGTHFVDRAGGVQFKARSDRYNTTTPAYTFGENVAAGEWPYEDCQLDYDSTHLSNQVTVTQESSGQTFAAQDAASITKFFPRTLTRTVNSSSANECQDATNYLLSRYKDPATRVSSIKLHPSANPALWSVCLSLELGTRVRVMRRPPGLTPVQADCFVENIAWDFGSDGEAFVTLQCSPADLTPYSIFAAWHTTLASSIASGVTSITVNASQDTTNPLAAQVGPGQSLILGQNSANQETVTVAAVGATSPGWTTAVITLTAATTKAHTAGDLVNEPLPARVTDPTTYDASSRFDSTAFAY